ncbi:MAG: hypothetical protein R2729_13885 [Bryobacteraceae bacterium]
MAKYKPVGKSTPEKPASTRGVVPCLLLVLGAIALVSFLFYAMLQSSVQ